MEEKSGTDELRDEVLLHNNKIHVTYAEKCDAFLHRYAGVSQIEEG